MFTFTKNYLDFHNLGVLLKGNKNYNTLKKEVEDMVNNNSNLFAHYRYLLNAIDYNDRDVLLKAIKCVRLSISISSESPNAKAIYRGDLKYKNISLTNCHIALQEGAYLCMTPSPADNYFLSDGTWRNSIPYRECDLFDPSKECYSSVKYNLDIKMIRPLIKELADFTNVPFNISPNIQ